MAGIRPFQEDDLPSVLGLHARAFRDLESEIPHHAPDWTEEAKAAHFRDVFLENPWRDDRLPSLVYCGQDGRIEGFLGVLPRPMSYRGKTVRAAVSTQFMVDPECKNRLAAVQLLKAFLSGPQDLSVADGAVNATQKLWEAVGGSAALLCSLDWTRPLRPMRYATSLVEEHKWLHALGRVCRPLSAIADAVAVRMRPNRFPQLSNGRLAPSDDLSADTWVESVCEQRNAAPFRPVLQQGSGQWLLDMVGRKQRHGKLRARVIRNADGAVGGWYLYYLLAGGISQVLQVGRAAMSMAEVLEHLFVDAWRNGAAAVQGRVEPRYLEDLWRKHCLIHRGSWVLVHSGDAALLSAIHRGDACPTRLDGEWWMRFLGG